MKPQVATFKRTVLFRRAISERNKHSQVFMFCQLPSYYLVGAKDSGASGRSWEPWKEIEDVRSPSHTPVPIQCPTSSPEDQRKKY